MESSTKSLIPEPIKENIATDHNLKVKKNRGILNRFIDVACRLVDQEFYVRSHKDVFSTNYQLCTEYLDILKQYDPLLISHALEMETTFKDVNLILHDLFVAIAQQLNTHIERQLSQTQFVSLMIDEISDIEMEPPKLALVLRYYLDQKMHDTFIGFIDVANGYSISRIIENINDILEKFDIKRKVIVQTYDGALSNRHVSIDLATEIRRIYPNAADVYCGAHKLTEILYQGFTNIFACKTFFKTIHGIGSFSTLREYLKLANPFLRPESWSDAQFLNIVSIYIEVFVEYFENIQNDENTNIHINDRMAAVGYIQFLKSFKTVFLLKVFSKIFRQCNEIYNSFFTVNLDIFMCSDQLSQLIEFIENLKEDGFQDLFLSTVKYVSPPDDINTEKYKELFAEIMENLSKQSSQISSSIEELKYVDLLNGYKFSMYRRKKRFTDDLIRCLVDNYPHFFQYTKLKNELMLFYKKSFDKNSRNIFAGIGPFDILVWLESNMLIDFKEVCKLAKLICTVPVEMTSSKSEYSALKKVKNFMRQTQGQKRLNDLSLLCIEKELLKELIESGGGFHNKVIENFVAIRERPEFIYK